MSEKETVNEWKMIDRKALDRDNAWMINLSHPETGRRLCVIINGDEVVVYNPTHVYPSQEET